VSTLMPEAPVNENYLLPSSQNDVWFAGQILLVKAKSVSHPVE